MGILATPEFWVAASFVGFIALILYFKAPGMIGKALDDRADRIRTELEEAQKLREEAQATLAEYQRKRRDAEKEAEGIISLAKEEAERLKVEAEAHMKEMLERRQRMAETKIAQAEAQAVNDVRAAAADAAIAAAENILTAKLSGDAADDFIAKSIEDVKTRLQ